MFADVKIVTVIIMDADYNVVGEFTSLHSLLFIMLVLLAIICVIKSYNNTLWQEKFQNTCNILTNMNDHQCMCAHSVEGG